MTIEGVGALARSERAPQMGGVEFGQLVRGEGVEGIHLRAFASLTRSALKG